VVDIGRSRVDVAHSFIEADMDGILHTLGFKVVPDYVLCSVRGVTEENATFGVKGKLGGAFSGWADPDAATKGTEIGEVILVFGASGYRGVVGTLDRKGIVNSEVQVESVGPEFCSQSTTE
jgi:hypothetical protein